MLGNPNSSKWCQSVAIVYPTPTKTCIWCFPGDVDLPWKKVLLPLERNIFSPRNPRLLPQKSSSYHSEAPQSPVFGKARKMCFPAQVGTWSLGGPISKLKTDRSSLLHFFSCIWFPLFRPNFTSPISWIWWRYMIQKGLTQQITPFVHVWSLDFGQIVFSETTDP